MDSGVREGHTRQNGTGRDREDPISIGGGWHERSMSIDTDAALWRPTLSLDWQDN